MKPKRDNKIEAMLARGVEKQRKKENDEIEIQSRTNK